MRATEMYERSESASMYTCSIPGSTACTHVTKSTVGYTTQSIRSFHEKLHGRRARELDSTTITCCQISSSSMQKVNPPNSSSDGLMLVWLPDSFVAHSSLNGAARNRMMPAVVPGVMACL